VKAEPNKYQIVKMKTDWVESLFPFDGFVELKDGVWLAEVHPELSERCEYATYLRDATEEEKKIWEAFKTLIEFYFNRKA